MGFAIEAPWEVAGAAAPTATKTVGKAAAAAHPDSLTQMSDMAFQAGKVGFVVGAHIAKKKAEAVQVYRIDSIEQDVVKATEQLDGHPGEVVELTVETMVEQWRLHKGRVTTLLPLWDREANPCKPVDSQAWIVDGVKGAIALALQERSTAYADALQHIELLANPTAVKAISNIAKGGVTFVAATQKVERCKGGAVQGQIAVGAGLFDLPGAPGTMFQLLPQFIPPVQQNGTANKLPWVAPFWAVGIADSAKEANMILKYEAVQIGKHTVQVPILQNSKAVKAGDTLLWHRATKAPPPRAEQGLKRKAHE